MKLPRWGRQAPPDEREEWMATAAKFANRLTESGSRCHLNDGSTRFCHWQATELPSGTAAVESEGQGDAGPMVGVRCTIHPGGRYLDPDARLDQSMFA